MGYTIFPDGPYGDALEAVYNEIKRAKQKHGPKNFNSSHEGYAVLLEEVDEMWEDIKHDRRAESVEEAVQVAAMAIRYIAELGTYPFVKSKQPLSDVKENVKHCAEIKKINEGDNGSVSVSSNYKLTGLSEDNIPSGI